MCDLTSSVKSYIWTHHKGYSDGQLTTNIQLCSAPVQQGIITQYLYSREKRTYKISKPKYATVNLFTVPCYMLWKYLTKCFALDLWSLLVEDKSKETQDWIKSSIHFCCRFNMLIWWNVYMRAISVQDTLQELQAMVDSRCTMVQWWSKCWSPFNRWALQAGRSKVWGHWKRKQVVTPLAAWTELNWKQIKMWLQLPWQAKSTSGWCYKEIRAWIA